MKPKSTRSYSPIQPQRGPGSILPDSGSSKDQIDFLSLRASYVPKQSRYKNILIVLGLDLESFSGVTHLGILLTSLKWTKLSFLIEPLSCSAVVSTLGFPWFKIGEQPTFVEMGYTSRIKFSSTRWVVCS